MSEHVLVARSHSEGDVLLAGPAIRAVAAGARRVTLLCGPRGRHAAALLPGVDEILIHELPWIDPEPKPVDPAATLGLVDCVARRAVDAALVLTSFHQSPLPLALLLRLAGVARIAAVSPDYPGSLLAVRHRVAADAHEVERSLSTAASLGYELPPGDGAGLRIRRPAPAGLTLAPPYVVVHPGASVSARSWGAERNTQLVRRLVAEGWRVVVTGGPTEKALTARVSGLSPRALDLGGRTTLAELAEVLAGAEATVVGNTGPAHLAAAVGTPVVSVYAPTVPAARWRPWAVPHELLQVDLPCAGCRARECPLAGHPCMEGLEVDDVVAAVGRLTASRDPTRAAA